MNKVYFNQPIQLLYKPASGLLAFGLGEVTEDALASVPQGELLIQVGDHVSIDTGRKFRGAITDIWLVVIGTDETTVAHIIETKDLPASMKALELPFEQVISIFRIAEKDITGGGPYFVKP